MKRGKPQADVLATHWHCFQVSHQDSCTSFRDLWPQKVSFLSPLDRPWFKKQQTWPNSLSDTQEALVSTRLVRVEISLQKKPPQFIITIISLLSKWCLHSTVPLSWMRIRTTKDKTHRHLSFICSRTRPTVDWPDETVWIMSGREAGCVRLLFISRCSRQERYGDKVHLFYIKWIFH